MNLKKTDETIKNNDNIINALQGINDAENWNIIKLKIDNIEKLTNDNKPSIV